MYIQCTSTCICTCMYTYAGWLIHRCILVLSPFSFICNKERNERGHKGCHNWDFSPVAATIHCTIYHRHPPSPHQHQSQPPFPCHLLHIPLLLTFFLQHILLHQTAVFLTYSPLPSTPYCHHPHKDTKLLWLISLSPTFLHPAATEVSTHSCSHWMW